MTQTQSTERHHLLPDGYQMRPTTLADMPEITALINQAMQEYDNTGMTATIEDITSDFTMPNYDITHSARVITDPSGKIVAEASINDADSKPVHIWTAFTILQNTLHREALETVLFDWLISTAREAVDRCDPGTRVILVTSVNSLDKTSQATYERMGFKQQRYYFRMKIEQHEEPPYPPTPAGFTLTTYRHPEDFERMIRAILDGFKDHFGFVESPWEEELAFFQHRIDNDKLFDPSLTYFVIDDATGNIAGICRARIEEREVPEHSYINTMAVLRPYRKRGLAKYLLKHTFAELYRRGKPNVTLHVDGMSLTGAVRLYESVGMHVDQQYTSFEYELRSGIEIGTTTVEED